jgi:hypothetical protein
VGLQALKAKINYKSGVLHPLVRFVTEETAALLFNLDEEVTAIGVELPNCHSHNADRVIYRAADWDAPAKTQSLLE